MEQIAQTLAGRVATVDLLPFSYAELRDAGCAPPSLEGALFHGGYPPLFDTPPAGAVPWLNSYLRTYVERDVRQALNVRDLCVFRRFLSLCAGSAGQFLNTAWECKSGMTVASDWTAGLAEWRQLAGNKAGRLHIVYGGDDSFRRQGTDVISWRDAEQR